MFAVIKTGGKQYRVAADDVIVVEKLAGDKGDSVNLSDVLMLVDGDAISVGAPIVKGALVSAEIVEQRKGDKVKVFKKTPPVDLSPQEWPPPAGERYSHHRRVGQQVKKVHRDGA